MDSSGYTRLPNSLARYKYMSTPAFRIYLLLSSFEPSFPSYRDIQKMTGIKNNATISRALIELEDKSLLRTIKVKGSNNYYEITHFDDEGYTVVPNAIIRSPILSAFDIRIYCALKSLNPCFPSYAWITKVTGVMSRKTIKESIDRFKEFGLLEVDETSRFHRLYNFLPQGKWSALFEEFFSCFRMGCVPKYTYGVYVGEHGVCTEMNTKNLKSNNPKKEDKEQRARTISISDDLDMGMSYDMPLGSRIDMSLGSGDPIPLYAPSLELPSRVEEMKENDNMIVFEMAGCDVGLKCGEVSEGEPGIDFMGSNDEIVGGDDEEDPGANGEDLTASHEGLAFSKESQLRGLKKKSPKDKFKALKEKQRQKISDFKRNRTDSEFTKKSEIKRKEYLERCKAQQKEKNRHRKDAVTKLRRNATGVFEQYCETMRKTGQQAQEKPAMWDMKLAAEMIKRISFEKAVRVVEFAVENWGKLKIHEKESERFEAPIFNMLLANWRYERWVTWMETGIPEKRKKPLSRKEKAELDGKKSQTSNDDGSEKTESQVKRTNTTLTEL